MRPAGRKLLPIVLIGLLAATATAGPPFGTSQRVLRWPAGIQEFVFLAPTGDSRLLSILDRNRGVTFLDLSGPRPLEPLLVIDADASTLDESSDGSLQFEDVTGDGVHDMIVQSEVAFVRAGRPDGTFEEPSSWYMGDDVHELRVGDFDGDGRRDLVVAQGGGEMFYRLGRSDGLFGPLTSRTLDPSASLVGLDDLDGDGDLDLLFATYDYGSDRTIHRFWRNSGAGQFTVLPGDTLSDAGVTWSRFGRHDRDGLPDRFRVVEESGDPEALRFLEVQRGLGAGRFAPPVRMALVPDNPDYLRDLDGDGLDDFVWNDDRLRVATTQPDGLLGQIEDYGASVYSSAFALHDLDEDGRPDLLFAQGGELRIISTRALATTPEPSIVRFHSSRSPLVFDADGDSRPDLVTIEAPFRTGPELAVRPGRSDATFGPPVIAPLDFSIGDDPEPGDFDGDGDTDLHISRRVEAGVEHRLLRNDGLGHFVPGPPVTFEEEESREVVVADFDGDGADDRLQVENDLLSCRIVLLRWSPSGECVRSSGSFDGDLGWLNALDLDGDGDLDLCALTGYGTRIVRFMGAGDGRFERLGTERLSERLYSFHVERVVESGSIQMIGSTYREIFRLEPDGAGRWRLGRRLLDTYARRYLPVPDLNGDGRPELGIFDGIFSGGTLMLLPSSGPDDLGDVIRIGLIGEADRLDFRDMTGDGLSEMIGTSRSGAWVYRGLPVEGGPPSEFRATAIGWNVQLSYRFDPAGDGNVRLVRRAVGSASPDVVLDERPASPHVSLTDTTIPTPGIYDYRLVLDIDDGYPRQVATARVMVAPEGEFRLLPLSPRPGAGPFTLQYASPVPVATMLEIFDVLGRRVRRIDVSLEATPAGTIVWNGRGEDGRPAASGLYFARLADRAGTVRVVLVR
ncbi:MAG TPA: FG-GAP-like repeat-containing protein [Candidatus Eisenbacteria bacterium]